MMVCTRIHPLPFGRLWVINAFHHLARSQPFGCGQVANDTRVQHMSVVGAMLLVAQMNSLSVHGLSNAPRDATPQANVGGVTAEVPCAKEQVCNQHALDALVP